MEQVKVCRICLIMDVKLYSLQTFPLLGYYELMIGLNPMRMNELPPFACYECAILLKKFNDFRDRVYQGQALLYGIHQLNGEISVDHINLLDRHALGLASPLTISNLNVEPIHVVSTDDSDSIKNEPNDTEDMSYSVDLMSFKNEDDADAPFDNNGQFDNDARSEGISSDDDEPLSLHKLIKEAKTKNKNEKKKKEEQSNDLPALLEPTGTEPTELESQPSVPVKRKRGRPSKSDLVLRAAALRKARRRPRRTANTGGVLEDEDDMMDLEDYVNVITLTLEEQLEEIKKREQTSNYQNAPYQCNLCYKGFIDTKAWEHHLSKHDPLEKQLEEIKKREQSSNYQNAPYQCNLCYKGFIDTKAWEHHLSKHDPSAGDVECPICKFRFLTKRKLQKHASNHGKKYACKSCPYVSQTSTQAKQHHRWHKGVTFKCQFCDEISTKWTSYLSHVRMKHPSEFICGVCGNSFVSKLGLTMHKTMMHKDVVENETEEGSESGPYCQECNVKFVSVEAYKRHMVTSAKHVKTDMKGCKECGETFKSQEEFRVHHRTQHARKRPKNYGKKPANNMKYPATCEHCAEVIPTAREFWVHYRRVHPDKSYPIKKNHVCDICGKSFRGNAFLVYHRRTHFEERAYKCSQCPKAFFNRTNLQMHEKVHSDTRPYPCDVCFKAFKCKGALDRHYRCHTGVKPYECEVCGKAFGQSNSRNVHVRTVHLRQPAPYLSKHRQERRRQNTQPPNTTNNPYFIY